RVRTLDRARPPPASFTYCSTIFAGCCAAVAKRRGPRVKTTRQARTRVRMAVTIETQREAESCKKSGFLRTARRNARFALRGISQKSGLKKRLRRTAHEGGVQPA